VPESPACAWQYISSVFFNCQINDVTFYSTRNATKKGDTSSFVFFFPLAIFRHFSTKKLGIYFYFLGFSSVISTNFSLFFGIKFRQIFYTQKMKTPLPLSSPAPPKKRRLKCFPQVLGSNLFGSNVIKNKIKDNLSTVFFFSIL
jgi:hypothetical protein